VNPLIIKAGQEVGELAWRYLLEPTIHKFAKNRKAEIQSWIEEDKTDEEIIVDNLGQS